MKKFLSIPILVLILAVFLFFKPFFINGELPIPSDTIIGLYHPFRDLYATDYPNGIPYKNFLITDPVRQEYPWRFLGIAIEKRGELPIWNPYSMGGTPLIGSLQSALFYPLNILFFILPFPLAWSLLIVLEPLLAGLFLYWYLKNLKLSSLASLFGAITFAFCGFSIAWLEWGTLVHISVWLPLILLSIDKLHLVFKNHQSKKQNIILWSVIFVFALSSSLFAGQLQFFAYVFLVVLLYFFARWFQQGKSKKDLLRFILLILCVLILTFIQWFPTIQFIFQSARDVDQLNWHKEGWFIPWQHLAQFIAPDFFGNPTTLNYWGVWNYGELVGYIGIVPLIMSIFALFYRRDKKTFFFGILFFLSLIFALPTIFAQLPYLFNIPLLSSSQPTRLLLITDFSLSVLAGLGLDWFAKKENKKQTIIPLIFIGICLALLWLIVLLNTSGNFLVAKHNLYLPTLLFGLSLITIVISIVSSNKKVIFGLLCFLIFITLFDLNRFGEKFTPFTNSAYLFPTTKSLNFLQNDQSQFRIMTTDDRILPPNFSLMYHLQSIDGYDPLYLRRYGELIAASERGKPDINPPFGFNRIITPRNTNSRIMDLMGVKYILSFADLPSPKFTKVFQEGQTKIYQNKDTFPRAFFVKNVMSVSSKQEAINALFDEKIDLHTSAIVEDSIGKTNYNQGTVTITNYSENTVTIQTNNTGAGFLIITDTYYPVWHAKACNVDGTDCGPTKIYLTDYNFRGVIVPSGQHRIVFYDTLL